MSLPKSYSDGPEPLVISNILNENSMLLVKPVTRAIVRKAHVSQLKRYMN